MGFAVFSDHDSRWFSVCFHRQSCPENRLIPALTKGLKSEDRIRRVQFDGRIKTRTKRDIFHDSDGRTTIGHFRFPNPIQRAGSGIGKSHPFVRSAPSFRPDLRTDSVVAHSGGQGWPVFGPPRQRRVASLTAASTAARSIASGNRSTPIRPSKSEHASPSKTEITLTSTAPRRQ